MRVWIGEGRGFRVPWKNLRGLAPSLIRLGNNSSQVFQGETFEVEGCVMCTLRVSMCECVHVVRPRSRGCSAPNFRRQNQLPQPDAMSSNDALRKLWLSAPPGRVSPWQQARALALREVSRELHAGRTHLEWVAARVEKVDGGNPGQDALHKFFTKVGWTLIGFLGSSARARGAGGRLYSHQQSGAVLRGQP